MKRTLEESRAYAEEIGVEWTAELEATLRSQGKIILGRAPANRDPRFAAADAIPTNKPIVRDPYANTVNGETNIDLDDPSSTGFNTVRGFVKGASHLPFVGKIDMAPDEHPESRLAKYSGLAGEMGGMATQLGATAPLFAPIGALGAGGGKLGQALWRGQQVGTQFGLYGSAEEGSLEDKAKAGLQSYLMGNAFGVAPFVPGLGRILGHKVLGPLADIGIFTGIEKAGGAETWQEALERGTVSALALRLAHTATGRPGTKAEAKTEAKAENVVDPVTAKKQAEIDALIGRRLTP